MMRNADREYRYVDALALLCRESQGLDQGQPLQAQGGLSQGEDGFQCGSQAVLLSIACH